MTQRQKLWQDSRNVLLLCTEIELHVRTRSRKPLYAVFRRGLKFMMSNASWTLQHVVGWDDDDRDWLSPDSD